MTYQDQSFPEFVQWMEFARSTRKLAPFLRELPPADNDLTQARARCPDCGIPTVPDHQELTHEARLCEACYLRWSEEDAPEPDDEREDATSTRHYPPLEGDA